MRSKSYLGRIFEKIHLVLTIIFLLVYVGYFADRTITYFQKSHDIDVVRTYLENQKNINTIDSDINNCLRIAMSKDAGYSERKSACKNTPLTRRDLNRKIHSREIYKTTYKNLKSLFDDLKTGNIQRLTYNKLYIGEYFLCLTFILIFFLAKFLFIWIFKKEN